MHRVYSGTIGVQIKCVTIQVAGQGTLKEARGMDEFTLRKRKQSCDEQMKLRSPK